MRQRSRTDRRERRRRLRARGSDDGAAAVEFALVLPILGVLLFGIVDYGLWFSDSLDARSAVESAARQAVIANVDTDSADCAPDAADGTATGDLDQLTCSIVNGSSVFVGKIYAKADVVGGGPWTVGGSLQVCETVDLGDSSLPFPGLPLPGHYVHAKVTMTIEKPLPDGTTDEPTAQQPALPAGQDWSWCD